MQSNKNFRQIKTAQPSAFGKREAGHRIIIEKNGNVRQFTIRPWITAIGAAMAIILAVGYLLGTSYLIFRDELLNATVARQAQMQSDYEKRIANLRNQLDRVTSRQLHDQQLVESKIDLLLEQQKLIELQQEQVTKASQASLQFGIDVTVPSIDDPVQRTDSFVTGSVSKPALGSVTGNFGGNSINDFNSASLSAKSDFEDVLLPLENSIVIARKTQFMYLEEILSQVANKHNKYAKTLKEFGVSVPSLTHDDGVGGPYEPIYDAEAFTAQYQHLQDNLHVLAGTIAKLSKVPLAFPIKGAAISSRYGRRIDPFKRRPAMHSGVDFKAKHGTAVKSTARGKVTFSGRKGGYGNLVEITHPSGYITRYAHLSKTYVKNGQQVPAGVKIGAVGSTGRSTGPHLHYEVRNSSKALNPSRFLSAGRQFGL